MKVPFYTVDVFTSEPFQGAPIAVFPHAEKIPESLYVSIAGEIGADECVFVLPPTSEHAIARLRVFGARGETLYPGHPTIAAAFALSSSGIWPLREGSNPGIFEQGGGPVTVRVNCRHGSPAQVWFSICKPAALDRYVPSAQDLAEILRLSETDIGLGELQPALASFDAPCLMVPLRNEEALRAARFSRARWEMSFAPSLASEILLLTHRTGNRDTDFHARLVGPDIGTHEDPPIGVATPALAAYLLEVEQRVQFIVDRGTTDRRRSVLHVESERKDGEIQVQVGGFAVMMSKGELFLGPAEARR